MLDPSKDQNGVLLSNEKDILNRWREYYKDLLNPVTITPPDAPEVHLRRKSPPLEPKSY